MKEREIVGKKDLKDALIELFQEKSEDIADLLIRLMSEDDRVATFAGQNFEPTEVYEEDVLFAFIYAGYKPEDVFREDHLEKWAEENGFVRKDDTDEG